MKNNTAKIFAAPAIIAAALALPPAAAGGSGGYKSLSARLVKCAAENAVVKIAVLDFAAKSGVGKNEAEYVAEKLGTALAGGNGPAVIERSLLDKVLREARLSSAVDGPIDAAGLLRDVFSIDAVVTGAVFADGETLKVLTRLIDIKTGRVLLAAETETGRLPQDTLKIMFDTMELPGVPMPELPAGWSAAAPSTAFPGFRDALSDSGDRSCHGRKLRLDRLNSELVDAKAGYWAGKMREPGFRTASLTRNPGSEIRDPGLKARFYELLAGYAGSAGNVAPGPDATARVLGLMRFEKEVSDECGLY